MKKLVVFFCLLILLSFGSLKLLARSAFAQENAVNSTPAMMQSSELTNLAIFLQGISFALIGNPNVAVQSGAQRDLGVVGFIAKGMDLMVSHPPASSVEYVAYIGSRLHVPGAPTIAYAANDGGYGYNALSPILPIWTMMRNLAYLIFAIIFVVIGFMIMLRVKIDPKTVTTIQSALPKMIFALLLVTFSYAIAGLLIDLMYLLIHLMFTIVVGAGLSVPARDAIQDYVLSGRSSILGPVGMLPGITTGVAGALAVGSVLFNFFIQPETWIITTLISIVVGGILGSVPGLIVGTGIGVTSPILFPFVAGIIGAIVIILMVLWALFKTFLMLLNAYANIILNIIFAPVLLIAEAIPGQNQFWNWLRSMLANLLVFPAVIGILLITTVIAVNGAVTGATGTLAGLPSSVLPKITLLASSIICGTPDNTNVAGPIRAVITAVCGAFQNPNPQSGFVPPLIGGNNLASMQALVALAILLTLPKTLEIIQEALKSPPFKYGSAWQQAISAPQWAANKYFSNKAADRKTDMEFLKNTNETAYREKAGNQKVDDAILGFINGIKPGK